MHAGLTDKAAHSEHGDKDFFFLKVLGSCRIVIWLSLPKMGTLSCYHPLTFCCVCVFVCACVCVSMHAFVSCVCACVCMRMSMLVCASVHACTCIVRSVCVCVCTCMHLF